MEAENRVFIYRVGQIPMVKAAYERAFSAYEATKSYNSLLGTTLQAAEDGVKYASETGAVKTILHNPLVSAANNIAVGQLDKLEEKYPSIKKTPDEVWGATRDYYEHSRIKDGLDKLCLTTQFGAAKMDETKKLCQSIVSGEVPPIEIFYDVLRRSLLALNGVLDYSDAFIDRYIAVNALENPAQYGSDDYSLANRVQLMSGKAYTGLKYQAATKYGETKAYIIQTLSDLQTAMALVEHMRNAATWANERATTTLTSAQEQAANLWGEIQKRSEPLGKRSEVVLLNLMQGLVSSMSSLSDQIVKYSTPYLPDSAEKKSGCCCELRPRIARFILQSCDSGRFAR